MHTAEPTMTVAVFFATREGQARRVAEHVADDLLDQGVAADLFDVRHLATPVEWSAYRSACVIASVHLRHHEREMIQFVRRHRSDLERLSAAFISITLSQAGVQDAHAAPDKREAASADVQRTTEVFIAETGWRPAHLLPVAGALAYRRYNFLIKLMMKRIARKAGAPTDTSRDYEFTDWPAIDRFVDALVAAPHTA